MATHAAASKPLLKTTRRSGKLTETASHTPLHLPDDVLYHILEYAAECTPYSKDGIAARYDVLRVTSLVCRSWRKLSQELLFREIVVGGNKLAETVGKVVNSPLFDRAKPFIRSVSLCGLARRQRAVRWIQPVNGRPDTSGLLKEGSPQQLLLSNFEGFEVEDLGFKDVTLPNLNTIILHDITTTSGPPSDTPNLSQLDTLAISNWTSAGVPTPALPDLRPLFASIPSTLRKLAYHQPKDDPNYPPLIALLRTCAATLTFLSLDHITPEVLSVLPSLSSLKTLIITIDNVSQAQIVLDCRMTGLRELGFDFRDHMPWRLRVDVLQAFKHALRLDRPIVRNLKSLSVGGANPQNFQGSWGAKEMALETREAGIEVHIYYPNRATKQDDELMTYTLRPALHKTEASDPDPKGYYDVFSDREKICESGAWCYAGTSDKYKPVAGMIAFDNTQFEIKEE
ncbi:hypothetical protein MNV49_003742 [Pseudohyphozyma bogoriensis]|nr:hypothetical protein MNV49_003742 [Pseudohyphozyma bogoriensis]